jgi:CDP-diacylglycerol--glycerol-3-phosphate 3-phosphatidyltransferase
MTTASKLTILRVLMIPAFMAVLLLWNHWVALAIFVLASVTDFADGYIARHYNQVSDFGKFLDPLADKLLVVSAMLIFVQWGRMPAWCVMIVLAREFAVTGLRLVAVDNGRVIAAGWSGKVKTASTMVGLCLMLAVGGCAPLDDIVTGVIVLTTLYSGVEYFARNWDVLNLKKS